MAQDQTKAKKTKISNRYAFTAKGEETANYTEATKCAYEYVNGVPEGVKAPRIDHDFSHIPDPIDRAFCIEGWQTKVGHAVNKAKNVEGLDYVGVGEAMNAWDAMIAEGGWSSEAGEFAGVGAVLEAISVLYGKTLDEVKAIWAAQPEADQKMLRSAPAVQTQIAKARYERLQARKADGGAPDALGKLFG